MPDLTGRRFVFVAYYWLPYRSGLTLHVSRVAEALVAAGADVRSIVARHEVGQPPEEALGGVRVQRLRVAARYDRAVVLPGLIPTVARAARGADVVVLVTPLAEGAPLAALVGRHARLAVYHICDPQLPPSRTAGAIMGVADASARSAVRGADLVVASSADYAAASRIVGGRRDVEAIPPPIDLGAFTRVDAARAREPGAPARVGYLGRLTHEKGLDRLIRAVPLASSPIELVLAGDSDGVAGGGEAGRLRELARKVGVSVELLGPLDDAEVAPFYRSLDVFALPSVNSLEAWGMAQVEAMLCGTPVVASALPGVRDVVERAGMGAVVPPDDPPALAAALEKVLADPGRFNRGREDVIQSLGLDTVLERHVQALGRLATEARGLRELQRNWQQLGERDARWAVLTDAGKRGNRWDQDAFYETGREEVDALLAELAEHDMSPGTGQALDFGCGAGRLTLALASHFDAAVGVDIAPAMIEQARAADRIEGRCRFVLNETDDLSFLEDGSVDLVYTSRVLQHMEPRLAIAYMREFVRVLRPDGTLVFQIPSRPSRSLAGRALAAMPRWGVEALRSVYQRSGATMEMHAVPEEEVRAVIAAAGAMVLRAAPDTAAGPRWESRRYFVRRVPAAVA